jgi:methyltransferase (TIGR00027 family)
MLERQSRVMVARTRAIDAIVRDVPQVVILGAGLDGRAWRLKSLSETVVFEVDHPDSQAVKRARVAALRQTAREIRFVPVDFTRDDLDTALAAAGHDAAKPTVWIWEGVVMYLALKDIEATLAIVQRRSAPNSRIAIVYHAPSWMLWMVGLVVGRMGEPLRSSFKPQAMAALLTRYGLTVESDVSFAQLGATMSPDIARAASFAKHIRLAIAGSK